MAPNSEVTGRVRLTTTDSVLRGLVLPCLPALAAQHPQLQLELRSANELMSLTRRDADLALRATPKAPEHLSGVTSAPSVSSLCGAKSLSPAQRRKALDQHGLDSAR